jgi:cob(I)alamin adenosyltransferase
MGLFYTGKGDRGLSSIAGKKYDKTCIEMQALGELDELNSLLGVVRSAPSTPFAYKDIVRKVQEDLFIVQADIYFIMVDEAEKAPVFSGEKTLWIETLINDFEKKVNPERGFVIPGETQPSAWFDYARAVSRKAERAVLGLAKTKVVNPDILAYLNRLSSLLFALARISVKEAGSKDRHPSYK